MVASEVPIFHENDFICKKVSLPDQPSIDITPHLDEIVAFIREGVQQGGILVHCLRGDTRSCSAVAAYLICYERMPAKKSFNLIRSKYPQFDVTDAHHKCLITYKKAVRRGTGKKLTSGFASLRKGRPRKENIPLEGFGPTMRRGIIRKEIKTLLKDFSKLNSTKQLQAEVKIKAQGSKTKRNLQAAMARKKNNLGFEKKKESNSPDNPLLSFGKEFIHKTYSSYLRNSRNQTVAIACRTALNNNKASLVTASSQRSTETSSQDKKQKGKSTVKAKRTARGSAG